MKKILFSVAVMAAALAANANPEGYFMLSVFSPGELPSPSYSIYGGRISLLYGECNELMGLDVGTAGYSRERLYGLQVNGIWSGAGTDAAGLQIGLVNTVDGDMAGLQLGLVNVTDRLYGMQIGLVNVVASRNWCFLPFINAGW